MDGLFFLNNLRWWVRLPVKWLVFGLTVLVVCFPHPGILMRHLRHWRNPNVLIQPHTPALQPLVRDLELRMPDDLAPRDALRIVERFVCERIRYDWDWNTWGTADYLPTVTEAIEKGREDCDGRAVVAASLLSRFGFKAQIVTDFAHVWVKTEHGELMGPGKAKAVIAERDGLNVRPGALAQLPRAIACGIAPFPLTRELVIMVVLWLLLLERPGVFADPRRRRTAWVRHLAALVFLLAGLLLMRTAGRSYYNPTEWMQLAGMLSIAAGVVLPLVWARGIRRAGLPTPQERI